jgi:nicotinamidase-related amidase
MSPLDLANLEPQRTAAVLIDLMPRIVDQPTEPHAGRDVLNRCVQVADAVRAAGGRVVWVTVERPGDDPQPEGSELAPECGPEPGDLLVVKHTWGAFHQTGLDEALRSRGVDTIVLGGIATNFGVESTARVADEHDYSLVFVSDAMTGIHGHAHDFAVGYTFRKLGTVTTTEEFVTAVAAPSLQ